MIFNRPPNLVLGAFTALFNIVVLVLAGQGVAIGADLVAAVNIGAAAVITLVAFQPPTLNPGDTLHVSTPNGQATITRVVTRTVDRPVAALIPASADVNGDPLAIDADDPGPAGNDLPPAGDRMP